MSSKNYSESTIQKGIWSDISGTIEHTETLTYLLRHAKLKQRNLVVTLIDLKNAFGKVHHQFLRKTFSFYNIPDSMIDLVMRPYDEFYLSINSKSFSANPIKVDRGLIQGDCLCPLLFNLCVNTLVNTVKNEKLNCFGYVYDFSFKPCNWFQFADDTAIVTSVEEDNQVLINGFIKWCPWVDLSVRIDKFHVIGMKKIGTKSCQYCSYLSINRERTPPIKIDDSFTYLGKDFNFGMDCAKCRQ